VTGTKQIRDETNLGDLCASCILSDAGVRECNSSTWKDGMLEGTFFLRETCSQQQWRQSIRQSCDFANLLGHVLQHTPIVDCFLPDSCAHCCGFLYFKDHSLHMPR